MVSAVYVILFTGCEYQVLLGLRYVGKRDVLVVPRNQNDHDK